MKFYGFATQTGARQPVIEAFREAGWRALARASPRTAYQIVGWRAPVVLAKPQNFIKNNIFKIAQIARQPPQTDVLSVGWRALARASPHGEVVHLRAGAHQSSKCNACQPTMYFPFQVVRRLRTEFARAAAAVAKARADLRAALEIYHDAKYRRMAFDWTYDVGAAGRGG